MKLQQESLKESWDCSRTQPQHVEQLGVTGAVKGMRGMGGTTPEETEPLENSTTNSGVQRHLVDKPRSGGLKHLQNN